MNDQSVLSFNEFYQTHQEILLGHHLSPRTIKCRKWMYRDIIGPEFGHKNMMTASTGELENFLDTQELFVRHGTVYSYFCFMYRLFSLLEMETSHPNPLTSLRAKYDIRSGH